jgi:hypothetical protein
MALQDFIGEVQVLGGDLVDKVKSLIHEGNVRRIIVRDEARNTFMEIPVTVAAVGAVLAPVLAAVGAISALVAKFTIVVVRAEEKRLPMERGAPGPSSSCASAHAPRGAFAAMRGQFRLLPRQFGGLLVLFKSESVQAACFYPPRRS